MARMKGARPAAARLSKIPPNPPSIRNNGPFEDFARFVHEQTNQYVEQFSDNDKSFIPFPVLCEYWTKARISRVLNASHPPLSFDIDGIKDGYIRTFSTLVYCNRITDFHNFTKYNLNDSRLPLEKRPDDWKDRFFDRLFSSISEHQWLFFPLVFKHIHLEDRHLDPRQILPIIKMDRLSHGRVIQGDAAVVQKIKIHDLCNSLVPQDGKGRPIQNIFALKTYHRPKFLRLYENEVKALRVLKNSRPPNVITYYGSFRQNNTFNIILEYADGGDLAEFLRTTQSPKGSEIQQVWESLSHSFKGLHSIHHLMNSGEKNVNGIHEDIKPENILLFRGPSGSRFDFVPKIADFGLFTHVRESNANSSEAMGLDKVGNQLYSSPESSHNAPYTEKAPNMINTRSDIFSFGAVLSDVCAWIKGGHDEIVRYRNRRIAHHRTIRTFRGNDYEGCFHDGVSRLPVVDEMHRSIREHCQSVNDTITPRIIDIMDKHMLLANVNDRYNAKQLEEKFQQIFDSPDQNSLKFTPDVDSLDRQVVTEPGNMSLADLGEILARQQAAGRHANSPTGSAIGYIEELVNDLKVNIPGRHHLIFIDNSTSMKEHANMVEKAFPALLYLTRELEGHKVELCFASDPGYLHRSRRRKKLIQLVANQQYRRGPDMMELSFGGLVNKVIIPRLPNRILGIKINFFPKKPTSIYVFTDGNWGDRERREACGVGRPLSRLRNELEERGLDKNDISFHFVRFGDAANGRQHLGYLDRSGRRDGRDNVDVKSVFSPIKSILIGPLSEDNDDSGEDD
ncbi:kinase-like domain-containing protein [Hypoxylon sp. FL1857]|nr:kinase-like domain-containing protein [Hypoxylon sp. FL1857]